MLPVQFLLTFTFLVLVSDLASAQEANKPSRILADSIFFLIKDKSVYRNRVDWNQVETAFRKQSDTAQTLIGQLSTFRYVFAQLGDVHSGLSVNNQYINYYKPVTGEQANQIKPLFELSRAQSGKFIVRTLEGGIVYILVPAVNAMGTEQINQYAQQFQDSLCQVARQPANGWIIDLRLNSGGNLYPMLSGMGNLIGEGMIGGQVDANGQYMQKWSIRNGEYHQDQYAMTALRRKCSLQNSDQKMAVLLGPITMSSGEAVAVALKGRANTRFFGEPTAEGYTTANNWYQIGPQIGLNLAEGYFADRNGIVYKDVVRPDQEVQGKDNFSNLSLDPKVQAALKWLKKG